MSFSLAKKRIGLVILLLAFFSSGVLSGVWFYKLRHPEPAQGILNPTNGQPASVDFSLFWDTWRVLQEKYPETLNYQQMVYGAISGMVSSLGDPYTIFMPPQETERFKEDYIDSQFEGVGMEIGLRKNQLQVISPLEQSPAKKAGLMAGDKILKVNGKDTVEMTLDETVNMIRGKKGTEVTLTILRNGWDEPKEFKLTRDIIQVPAMKWEIKGDIAYIQLYQFSEKLLSDFDFTAGEIAASPAKKIILDLRNNPGGFLEVAQAIAGYFLDRGEVVTIEQFSKGNQQVYKSKGPTSLKSYPIVILINQGSASASEILAGALRDDRKIKLIGEKSFGKGSVQELQQLPGGASVKVTVANWLTPSGQLITERGLDPDVKVGMTEKDVEAGKDSQLDAAIELLKNM